MTGHSELVVSLGCAAKFFVSSSQDKSVLFWDPQLQKHQHKLKFESTPFIAIHPEEELVVVLYESERCHVIEYYRHANLKHSIEKKTFLKEGRIAWTGIKFSLDSMKLLITTNSSKIIVMDSVKLEILVEFKGLRTQATIWYIKQLSALFVDFKHEIGLSLDACFSLDSKFVFGGSTDGLINVWDFKSPLIAHRLNPQCKGPCRSVAFNPKFMNLATATSDFELQLWNDHWIMKLRLQRRCMWLWQFNKTRTIFLFSQSRKFSFFYFLG